MHVIQYPESHPRISGSLILQINWQVSLLDVLILFAVLARKLGIPHITVTAASHPFKRENSTIAYGIGVAEEAPIQRMTDISIKG